MSRASPLREVVMAALRECPQIATKTLARMLRTRHPELFHSLEHARTTIRNYRGANGQSQLKQYKDIIPRTAEESEACRRWGGVLPEPEVTEWGWQALPEEVTRWLILADLHVPYHDLTALKVVLEHAADNCDGVLLLGDVVDFYQLSAFCKDPRKRDVAREVDDVRRLLDVLAAQWVKRIVFKAGNHEARFERYCMLRAPDLWPLIAAEFSLPVVFETAKRNIQWVRAQDPIGHHALTLLHGHEFGNRFSSPVNPARGAFLKAHDCVLQGHEHRSSHHAETTLTGTTIQTWSLGCLCNLHPEYRPLGSKWDHSFCYLNAGSEWSIEPHGIIDGKVMG